MKRTLKRNTIYLFLILFCLFTLSVNAYAKERQGIRLEQNGKYLTFQSDQQLKPANSRKARIAQTLPSRYDLRNVNGVTYINPPELQNPWGCCWSFAALSAAESNALLDGAKGVNFSKRAFAWYCYQNQNAKGVPEDQYEGVSYYNPDPTLNQILPFQAGGDLGTPPSQMATWNGASTSNEIPYQNDQGIQVQSKFPNVIEYSPDGTWSLPYADIYQNAYHLQNSDTISVNQQNLTTQDIDEITQDTKQLLLDNGALFLGFGIYDDTQYFNSQTWAQYVSKPEAPNHAVSIIGWDDNYAIDNFNAANRPPAPGVWICKNNWSTAWGDGGYFYLSYYDRTITGITAFDVEAQSQGYSYDNNLEYDFVGDKLGLSTASANDVTLELQQEGVSPGAVKVGNVFKTDEQQILRAVSAYTTYRTPSVVTTKIYLLNEDYQNPEDGTLVETQTDNLSSSGINTLVLKTPVELEANQAFAVVQNIVYTDLEYTDGTVSLAGLPIEFGVSRPFDVQTVNYNNEPLDMTCTVHVNVEPQTSYVSGIVQDNPSQWFDISSETVQDALTVPIDNYLEQPDCYAVPGNAMIKAYTTDVERAEIPATDISINNDVMNIYLATSSAGPDVISSQLLTATVKPQYSTSPITWEITDSTIATISATSGSSITVNAVNEGITQVRATSASAVTTVNIIVSNAKVTCSEVIIQPDSASYYTVIAKGVVPNPALNDSNASIRKVSLFNWSEPNQSDMNAKIMDQIPGTNDWQYEGVPINDNESNNYFVRADKIHINVYGTTDSSTDGDLLSAGNYKWINQDTANNYNIGYIGYCQDLGFVKPADFDGFTAGTVGRILNLEGLRVSSNIDGVNVTTRVHVQNIGWLDPFDDGVYAGTMHQNLGLEAVQLTLSGPNASNYKIVYRAHQRNNGWLNWVENGATAGSTGENLQLEAIEIRLEKLNK